MRGFSCAYTSTVKIYAGCTLWADRQLFAHHVLETADRVRLFTREHIYIESSTYAGRVSALSPLRAVMVASEKAPTLNC